MGEKEGYVGGIMRATRKQRKVEVKSQENIHSAQQTVGTGKAEIIKKGLQDRCVNEYPIIGGTLCSIRLSDMRVSSNNCRNLPAADIAINLVSTWD